MSAGTDKDICNGVEDAVCNYQRSDWTTVKVGVVKTAKGVKEAHSGWRYGDGYRDVITNETLMSWI